MSANNFNVRAQRLPFAFADRPLLEDVTFHLTRGWTGCSWCTPSSLRGKST